MKQSFLLGVGAVAVISLSWNALPLRGPLALPRELAFEELGLHLEVDLPPDWSRRQLVLARAGSFLDLPAEVVLTAKAPRGLSRLQVVDAAGRVVFGLECSKEATHGVAELELECEGATLRDVLREYPRGLYSVQATTTDGVAVEGDVVLCARLPGVFAVLAPDPGSVLPLDDATISWTPSQGARGYVLEIESEALGFELRVRLPADRTSFTVPADLLQRGEAYEYSLAVQGDADNELEAEGGFFTARAWH